MPNLSSINSIALNAPTGFSATGSGNIIAIEQTVGVIGSGNLVGVEQTIGLVESGNLVSFEQDVQLRATGSGALIDIEQTLRSIASGNLIALQQYVFNTPEEVETPAPGPVPEPAPSWFVRNGWDAIIQIGGVIIDNSKIHGAIEVERKEGAAALANITLIPDTGVQDVLAYSGKPITIDARTSSGVRRIFTGIVDIPDVKLIEKKIVLRCSDRREEKINSDHAAIVNTIGYYSSDIFNSLDDDVTSQLKDRLSTVPKAFDFDAYGYPRVTNLLAKSSADYELTDPEVFRKEPTVSFLSRARITNSVNVEYKYRYTRLYHWTRNFSWTSPIANNFCLFAQSGYQLTPKRMIVQAATAAGWPLNGTISFTDTPGSGWICGGIGWLAASTYGYFSQVTDENGNTVSDASGSPVYSLNNVAAQTNLTTLFATAATWSAGTRWSQIVEEKFTLNVKSPQSIAQYGTIEGYVGSDYETPAETDEWEDYSSYDSQGLGANFRTDLDTGRNNFNYVQAILISQAKTMIIKSHRDTRVTFHRTLWPEVELHNTVRINTGPIVATGKVLSIKHSLDILTGADETTVTLALCKAQGSASTNVPSILPKPTDVAFSPDTSTIYLQSHYGQDPDAHPEWTGYAGNINTGQLQTFYSPRFIVDTPPVPDEYRSLRTINGGGGSYDLELQDDELVITF